MRERERESMRVPASMALLRVCERMSQACVFTGRYQPVFIAARNNRRKKDKTLLFKDFCSLVFLTVQYKHSGAVTGLWGGKEREDGEGSGG